MRPVRFRDNDWYAGLAPPEHYEGVEFLNGDDFLIIADHLRYRIIMPCNTIVTDCTADYVASVIGADCAGEPYELPQCYYGTLCVPDNDNRVIVVTLDPAFASTLADLEHKRHGQLLILQDIQRNDAFDQMVREGKCRPQN